MTAETGLTTLEALTPGAPAGRVAASNASPGSGCPMSCLAAGPGYEGDAENALWRPVTLALRRGLSRLGLMSMSRAAFENVALSVIFPQLAPAGIEAVRGAARAADAVRVQESAPRWERAPDLRQPSGLQSGSSVLLLADVVVHADRVDQTEFRLQALRTDQRQIAVNAAVNVACSCETDHATHDVDIDRTVPLAEARRSGACNWSAAKREQSADDRTRPQSLAVTEVRRRGRCRGHRRDPVKSRFPAGRS